MQRASIKLLGRFVFIIIIILRAGFLYQPLIGQVTTEQIKASLIVHFCENVQWINPLDGELKIGLYTDNQSVYRILESVKNRVKIQGKRFEPVLINSMDEIKNYHAVYFSHSETKDLISAFNTSRENNVLLITDNYPDQLFVMINLIDEGEKVSFKVNVPNLTTAGFTIQPNLLLNGGSVVDIKSAFSKFEMQLDESRRKLELSQKAVMNSEMLLQQRDMVIKQRENEINKLLTEIANYRETARKLEDQVNREKQVLSEKSIQLQQKDKELAKIYADIELKLNELTLLKENVELLQMQSDSLREEISQTRDILHQKEEFILSQRKVIVLFLGFMIALVIAGFAISRLLFIKRRHNRELEEKVNLRTRELNLSNQQYISLVNLAPVAIWEVDLSESRKFLDSRQIFSEKEFEGRLKKHPDLLTDCMKKVRFMQANKASLDLFGIHDINDLSGIYGKMLATGGYEDLARDFSLFFREDNMHSYEGIRCNSNDEKIDLLIKRLDISPEKSSFTRVLVTMVDITRLREVERELLKHQEQLELLVKERTEEIEVLNEELAAQNELLFSGNKKLEKLNNELTHKNQELLNQKQELDRTLSELKQAQMQMIQSEKMASLGVMTAGVAHEINNPLNFIMGAYTGLFSFFEEKNLRHDKKITMLLEGLKTGVERTADIVKSLNQFSRSKDSFDENCDLAAIIDNCLIILNNAIKNRIEIKKNYIPGQSVLSGNQGKLHQVFLNILNNSVQAIEGKGLISIDIQKSDRKFSIEIRDTGCGITKENLSKVLDPFFTTKDPGKGTGLGLSITYNIIKEHHGTLYIDSEPGSGTRVSIELPIFEND